jgi:alpha-1,2-mannosyltransferase
MSASAARLVTELERLGRLRFVLLFGFVLLNVCWVINAVAANWWLQSPKLVTADGEIVGQDFISFYAAAHVARAGEPAAAYDFPRHHEVEREIIGAPIRFAPWLYPPTFLMIVLPLAFFGYGTALALWLGAQLVGFLGLFRRLIPHPLAPLSVLLFPATTESFFAGQNGIFSALLLTGGLCHLDRRPLLAGLFFGTLSYKPQMAVAAYAALLFGGYFRALAAACVTAGCLATASALIFGLAPWLAFLQQLDVAREGLESGKFAWDELVTVFAAARLLGLSVTTAWLLQAAAATGAFAAIAYVWRRHGSLAWRGSILAAAIPLTTPYGFFYDLVPLVLPLTWLLIAGRSTGFRRGEIAVVAMAWIVAAMGFVLASAWHLLVTPIVLILVALVVLRRAREPSSAIA